MIRNWLVSTTFAALGVGALLAGCGGGDGGPTAATGGTTGTQQQAQHNDADLAFAQQMIPHHTEALEMAALTQGRTTNPKVLDLAKRVQDTQNPEIQQLTAWVDKWGATPSTPSSESMPGTGHGSGHGEAMPGAMSGADMAELEKAKGNAFDRMWLDMMIKHHEGAIEMARTELSQGVNSDAKSLAQQIIDGQQAEITEMRGLLSAN